MAWTNPRTWTDTELVTASIMNTHVRDNLNATGPHLLVRKTIDQTNSTTTLVDDDQLFFPVLANEVWQFYWLVSVQSSDNWKMGITIPASSSIKGWFSESGGARIFESGGGTQKTLTTWQSGLGSVFRIEGFYTGAGTAGNVKLQWACATAVSCVVRANSTLWGVKLA